MTESVNIAPETFTTAVKALLDLGAGPTEIATTFFMLGHGRGYDSGAEATYSFFVGQDSGCQDPECLSCRDESDDLDYTDSSDYQAGSDRSPRSPGFYL